MTTSSPNEPSKYPIYMNAFQMGVIAAVLTKDYVQSDPWKEKVVKDILDQIEKYHVKWKMLEK